MVSSGLRRLFIALSLPAATDQQLSPYCSPHAGIRWIGTANRHLTLAFIGQCTEEQAIKAAEIVNRLETTSFEMQLASLQRFPDDTGSVIAAIPAPNEPLERLRQQIVVLLTAQGFAVKRGIFRPHITLGKINRGTWSPCQPRPSHNHEARGHHTISKRTDRHGGNLSPAGIKNTGLRLLLTFAKNL